MKQYHLWFLILFIMCKPTATKMRHEFEPEFTPGPQTVVYKTRGNYANLVPIGLSEDKANIVSYPHPDDLKPGGKFSTPTALKKDYWLDNRGISKNLAFIKLTYEEYSKLESPPSLKELYQMIVDKDPLLELCDCGNRLNYADAIVELNDAIDKGMIRRKCKIQK